MTGQDCTQAHDRVSSAARPAPPRVPGARILEWGGEAWLVLITCGDAYDRGTDSGEDMVVAAVPQSANGI